MSQMMLFFVVRGYAWLYMHSTHFSCYACEHSRNCMHAMHVRVRDVERGFVSHETCCASLSIETHTQKLSQKTFPELSDACVFWVVRVVSCHTCIYFSYMHDMTRAFVHLREWWKCGYLYLNFFVAYYIHMIIYVSNDAIFRRPCMWYICVAWLYMHVRVRDVRARGFVSRDRIIMLCVSLSLDIYTRHTFCVTNLLSWIFWSYASFACMSVSARSQYVWRESLINFAECVCRISIA